MPRKKRIMNTVVELKRYNVEFLSSSGRVSANVSWVNDRTYNDIDELPYAVDQVAIYTSMLAKQFSRVRVRDYIGIAVIVNFSDMRQGRSYGDIRMGIAYGSYNTRIAARATGIYYDYSFHISKIKKPHRIISNIPYTFQVDIKTIAERWPDLLRVDDPDMAKLGIQKLTTVFDTLYSI